jgi:uncharacterized protein YndB with AHSA1/START domain
VSWLIVAGLVVVAGVGIVMIIGVMLPRDHIAAMSATIAAAPDAVWAALVDPAGYPAWRSDVQRVEVLPPVVTGACWREHGKHGAITYVVDVSEPPRRLVTRIADTHLPFGGQWEYRIEPTGSHSSTVTIVERGSVHNPLFRFVSRFIMGHTATIDAYLCALGKRFGGGESPTIVALDPAHGT